MPDTPPMSEGARGGIGLRTLYEEHAEAVRQLLARLLGPSGEVDDLLHEVFLVASRRPNPYEDVADRAWLCGIAVKLARAARRRARLRRFVGLSAASSLVQSSTPASLFERRAASEVVYSVLERLPEKKRLVFVLFELQQMSGAEIAQALDIPLATVKTRLFHARRDFEVELARWKAREEARAVRQR